MDILSVSDPVGQNLYSLFFLLFIITQEWIYYIHFVGEKLRLRISLIILGLKLVMYEVLFMFVKLERQNLL